jgi:hypothetical protein
VNAALLWTVKLYEAKYGFKVVLEGMGRKVVGHGTDIEAAMRHAQAQLVYKAPFEVAK